MLDSKVYINYLYQLCGGGRGGGGGGEDDQTLIETWSNNRYFSWVSNKRKLGQGWQNHFYACYHTFHEFWLVGLNGLVKYIWGQCQTYDLMM